MLPRAAVAEDLFVSEPPRSQGAPAGVDSRRGEARRDESAHDNHERLRVMFDSHHQVLWRTLCRYGLDPDAAADIGQQAYLVALERIDDIWPGSERAFLVGTALRLARKHRHKAARLRLESSVDERVQARASAESQAIALELLDRVLSQLDADLVEVFVLFDVEGFSTKEVAATLDVPEGTVASRLRRARQAFRAATQRLDHVSKREEGGR
jgi:RNA polymerase sigma-70 factor (ECF subfamily)